MTTEEFIRLALEEDVRDGDHTSLACIPVDKQSRAKLLVKDDGVLAGIKVAKAIFREVDESLNMDIMAADGDLIRKGDIAFIVTGSAQSILKAERLVLNLMQRMSGIATTTSKYVKAVEGYNTKVLDTRKTTPLLRYFEKLAVKIGGGENHRFGLYDMIMIKDNHIHYAGGIKQAITATRQYLKDKNLNLKVEIEARNLDAVKEMLEIGQIDRIMLDNFTPEQCKEAVQLIAGRYETEISGGITLDSIRSYAAAGADYISVGALTHSVKSLDLSLKAF